MKNVIVRGMALLLAFAFTGAVFSGCSSAIEDNYSPEKYFSEIRADADVVYNKYGSFSVNLTSDDAAFNQDIGIDDIRIYYCNPDIANLPEIYAQTAIELAENEYKETRLTPLKVVRNSEKNVTVDFTDEDFSKNRPLSVILIFDTDCNSVNKYLFACADISYSRYNLVSDTTQVLSDDSQLKIKLTLDGSAFTSDVYEQHIALAEGFSDCRIQSVEKTGDNTINVVLNGHADSECGYGVITVSSDAISNAAFDTSVKIKIASPSVVFRADTFEASEKSAKLEISLNDCTFSEDSAAYMFACSDKNISVSRFDRLSATEGILYLGLETEGADATAEKIAEANFTVDKNALNVNKSLEFTAVPLQPDVDIVISSVTENESDLSVVIDIQALNGNFNIIGRNSFVFGGDFSKAGIASFSSGDSKTSVTLTVPKNSVKSYTELYGTVALKQGSVSSYWGTTQPISAFSVYYNSADSDNYVDYDDMLPPQDALELYAVHLAGAQPSDLSSMTDIFSESTGENGITLAEYYEHIAADNAAVSDMLRKAREAADAEMAGNTAERMVMKAYMSDLCSLWAAVRNVSDDMYELYSIEKEIFDCTDSQELEKLYVQHKTLSNKIISLYSTKIKGTEFTYAVADITDRFTGSGVSLSALECRDKLSDSTHNWRAQTVFEKNEFRNAVAAVIMQASAVSLYAMCYNSEITADNTVYFSVIRRVNELSAFLAKNKVHSETGKYRYCNTLNKYVSLESFDVSTDEFSTGLKSDEISQLVSMLPHGVSLKEELCGIGLKTGSVRYILCSDGGVSTAVLASSASDEGSAEKLYSNTGKALVYDLVSQEFLTDFEFRNVVTVISADEESLSSEMKAYTLLDLYILE